MRTSLRSASRTSPVSGTSPAGLAGRWCWRPTIRVFELRGALVALFGVDDLGRDAHPPPERSAGGIRTSIIITVDRAEDVDELTERARMAGARVTKEPVAAEFFDGRDAYFADPEGNFWEVAWSAIDNPVTAAARRAAGQ